MGPNVCPLLLAIKRNHARVVQVLLDRGVSAIGGLHVVEKVLLSQIGHRQPKFLPILLNAEGEEKQAHWANISPVSSPLLHVAASFGNLAAMRVLLSAGADETAPGCDGKLPGEMVGFHAASLRILNLTVPDVDSVTAAAVRRVLERAPAFRALSWLFPIETVGCRAEEDSNGGALYPSPRIQKASFAVVRVYRPQREISFVKRIAR